MSAVALAVAVGMPVIVPVELFRTRPAGRVPLVRAHEYGVVPPIAARVAL
jgi:hypothetical protein